MIRLPFFFTLLLTFLSKPLLLPYPNSISYGNNSFIIDPCGLNIRLSSIDSEFSYIPSHAEEIIHFFFEKSFSGINCDEKNINFAKFSVLFNPNKKMHKLTLEVDDWELRIPTEKTDESYELKIQNEQDWMLKSKTYVGFLRGLDSLFQLISTQDFGTRCFIF